MRISGSGTGNGSFGNGGSRSDNFRRKHRVGQKVRGLLLKNLPDAMAWVDIDGDRLLAQLESAHPEGSRLFFLVQKLTPQIVLKELPWTGGGKGDGLSLMGDFDTARTLFENRFRPALSEADLSGKPLPLALFLKLLAGSPALRTAYLDAADCARTIGKTLDGAGKGRLLYQPWLAPDGRRQATLIRGGGAAEGLTETLVEHDHARMGLVRVQFLTRNNDLTCKVLLQHPEQSTPLARYLASRAHGGPVAINHLGVGRLPRTSHGGIVAEALFQR
jgi:hypothetical protein